MSTKERMRYYTDKELILTNILIDLNDLKSGQPLPGADALISRIYYDAWVRLTLRTLSKRKGIEGEVKEFIKAKHSC